MPICIGKLQKLLNAGLDSVFGKNRINGTIDVYSTKTECPDN